MGDFLENRLKELEKTKRFLNLEPAKKELYFNLVRDAVKKTTIDHEITEEVLFEKNKKREKSLPRQEAQHEIIEAA